LAGFANCCCHIIFHCNCFEREETELRRILVIRCYLDSQACSIRPTDTNHPDRPQVCLINWLASKSGKKVLVTLSPVLAFWHVTRFEWPQSTWWPRLSKWKKTWPQPMSSLTRHAPTSGIWALCHGATK